MDALPPTPPFRRAPPPNQPNQTSSPLNPASSPHAIAIPRRLSATGYPYGRKSFSYNSPNTPTRFLSPRTPLSFLAHSPTTSSNVSHLSSSSSVGWQLRTPTTTANSASDLPSPSPASLPPADLPLANRSSTHSANCSKIHNVKFPHTGAAFGEHNGSPSFGLRTGRPSPLDNKFAYLQSIPPSPPIMIPSAQLLEMDPTPGVNVNTQYSIASPFVNLKLSPSPPLAKPGPVSAISPLLTGSRRSSADRRGSSLARELHQLDVTDGRSASQPNIPPNQIARVPEPNPASPTVSRAPSPTTPI